MQTQVFKKQCNINHLQSFSSNPSSDTAIQVIEALHDIWQRSFKLRSECRGVLHRSTTVMKDVGHQHKPSNLGWNRGLLECQGFCENLHNLNATTTNEYSCNENYTRDIIWIKELQEHQNTVRLLNYKIITTAIPKPQQLNWTIRR